MTLSQSQIEALSAPLSSAKVKTRQQSGRELSYIEGWWAISEANRIFGFDGWTRETVEFKCVAEHERAIGRNSDKGWGVTYIAKVRVMVGNLMREGCGTGHGIDRDKGQAHESALKEAETDAMKRALMTFGNPFGLALYDKQQNGVSDDASPPPQPSAAAPKAPYEDPDGQMKAWCDAQKTFLSNCEEISDVTAWEELRADALSRLKRKNLAAWSDLVRFKENRIGNINLRTTKEAAE
jgi:DNA recombination protein Rad52